MDPIRQIPPEELALLAQLAIPPERVARLVPIVDKLYSKVYVNATDTMSANTGVELYHAGRGDTRDKLNHGAAGTIDKTDTNLIANGCIEQGTLFIALGWGVRYPTDVSKADLTKFDLVEVAWGKRGSDAKLRLGYMGDAPSRHRIGYALGYAAGGGDTATAVEEVDRNAHIIGPVKMGSVALFGIDGNVLDAQRESMVLTSPADLTPSATVNPFIEVYGIRYSKLPV